MTKEFKPLDNLLTLRQLLAAATALVARAEAADGNLQQIGDELRATSALIEGRLREWRESVN